MISKGDNWYLLMAVDIMLRNTKGRMLGQGILKDPIILANWVLITPLIHSIRPEDEGWQVQWKCCNISQISCICCRIYTIKWVPQSLWILIGSLQVRKILSRNILVTAVAVAVWHGKASIQWNYIPSLSIYSREWGNLIKSTCQTSGF